MKSDVCRILYVQSTGNQQQQANRNIIFFIIKTYISKISNFIHNIKKKNDSQEFVKKLTIIQQEKTEVDQVQGDSNRISNKVKILWTRYLSQDFFNDAKIWPTQLTQTQLTSKRLRQVIIIKK